jgi:hypothetical protein
VRDLWANVRAEAERYCLLLAGLPTESLSPPYRSGRVGPPTLLGYVRRGKTVAPVAASSWVEDAASGASLLLEACVAASFTGSNAGRPAWFPGALESREATIIRFALPAPRDAPAGAAAIKFLAGVIKTGRDHHAIFAGTASRLIASLLLEKLFPDEFHQRPVY